MGSYGSVANSGLVTIQPSGYITAANAGEVQAELATTVTQKGASSFLVDMHQVEFIDSAGLMALVSALRLSQNLGKRFVLCSIPAPVQIVFEVTQLDKVFEIWETRKEFAAVSPLYEAEVA